MWYGMVVTIARARTSRRRRRRRRRCRHSSCNRISVNDLSVGEGEEVGVVGGQAGNAEETFFGSHGHERPFKMFRAGTR
jgi:hypothetical protein